MKGKRGRTNNFLEALMFGDTEISAILKSMGIDVEEKDKFNKVKGDPKCKRCNLDDIYSPITEDDYLCDLCKKDIIKHKNGGDDVILPD